MIHKSGRRRRPSTSNRKKSGRRRPSTSHRKKSGRRRRPSTSHRKKSGRRRRPSTSHRKKSGIDLGLLDLPVTVHQAAATIALAEPALVTVGALSNTLIAAIRSALEAWRMLQPNSPNQIMIITSAARRTAEATFPREFTRLNEDFARMRSQLAIYISRVVGEALWRLGVWSARNAWLLALYVWYKVKERMRRFLEQQGVIEPGGGGPDGGPDGGGIVLLPHQQPRQRPRGPAAGVAPPVLPGAVVAGGGPIIFPPAAPAAVVPAGPVPGSAAWIAAGGDIGDYICCICNEPTNYRTTICNHTLCLGCSQSCLTVTTSQYHLGSVEVRGALTFPCPMCRRPGLISPTNYDPGPDGRGTFLNLGSMERRPDSLPGIEEEEFVPRIVSSPGSEQPPDDYDPFAIPDDDDDPLFAIPDDDDDDPFAIPDDDDPVVPPRPAGPECQRDPLAYTDASAYLMGLMNRDATPCSQLRRTVCRPHSPAWSAYGVKCEDVPHCEWNGRCVEKAEYDLETNEEAQIREDYRQRLLLEARARARAR